MNNDVLNKLIYYLLDEINDNIKFFYNKYHSKFDQSYEDLNNKGETIQQYNIYKKYWTKL